MSLLDTQQLTTDQAKAKLRGRVLGGIRRLFQIMLDEYTTDFSMVWNNPDGLSQADALAALGTDAAEVFALATILKTAVNQAKPDAITTAAPDVTVNADGTVTLETA